MARNRLLWSASFAAIFLPSAQISAKETYSYPYAHVRYIEGEVQLQRATEPDPGEAGINHPVTEGDRVWTRSYAKAEIELSDGSLLRMDERTKIDFSDFGDSSREALLRLWSGSIILRLTTEPGSNIRVDTPAGSIYPASTGVIRIDVNDGGRSTVLSVYEGVAELASEGGSILVRSGQRSLVEPGRRPEPSFEFNTARMDEFAAWSDERDRTYAQTTTIEGLPEEVAVYADDLEPHGTWQVDAQLGSVWYPQVSAGWYPYSQGYWSFSIFGWTWISHESWGWAPYHYGRWGHNYRGWYWIPGAHWGPAWVSWSIGPQWVGWCPLGYYDRPVAVPYYRGGRAVPRSGGGHAVAGARVSAGWSYAKAGHSGARTLGRARLRAEDVRATAHQARHLESGAILDRNLEPRAVGAAAMTRMPKGGLAELRGRQEGGTLRQGQAVVTRPLNRSRTSVSSRSTGELQKGRGMATATQRSGSSRSAAKVPGSNSKRTRLQQGEATSGSSAEPSRRDAGQRNPTLSRPGAIQRGGEARQEAGRNESPSRREPVRRRTNSSSSRQESTRNDRDRAKQSASPERFGASSALKRVERSLRSPRSTSSGTGDSSRSRATSPRGTSKTRTGATQRKSSSSSSRGKDFFSRRPSGTSRSATPPRSQPNARPSGSRPGGQGSAAAPRGAGGNRSKSAGKARSTRSSSTKKKKN